MEAKNSLLKKVLTGLFKEVSDVENKIKKSGIVPREICDYCLTTNKRNVVGFSSKEKTKLVGSK